MHIGCDPYFPGVFLMKITWWTPGLRTYGTLNDAILQQYLGSKLQLIVNKRVSQFIVQHTRVVTIVFGTDTKNPYTYSMDS